MTFWLKHVCLGLLRTLNDILEMLKRFFETLKRIVGTL